MKHYKTVEIPASTAQKLESVTCDLCGKKMEHVTYEVDDVEISHKTGSQYPEGGSGEYVRVDMCGKCFDGKLIPWLKSQGCEPSTEDWDF